MISWLKTHEIMVVKRTPPLRVRMTERSEEIRESILNKKLEMIRNKHDLANLEETRRAIEKWLEEDRKADDSGQGGAPEMPTLQEVVDGGIYAGSHGNRSRA